MKVQVRLPSFERNLIIGRRYTYYRHRGCGGEVHMIGLLGVNTELEIARKRFNGDLRAYRSWLEAVDADLYDYICLRCFTIIRGVKTYDEFHDRVVKPDPHKAEFVEEFKYVPYEEHINIISKAYRNVKKYKDGVSCKDTYLASEIGRILKERGLQPKGINPEGLGLRVVGMPVVDWAIEQSLFEVAREVEYDIPYAYRRHGWRGIKSTIYWRVLKPTEAFLEKVSGLKEVKV